MVYRRQSLTSTEQWDKATATNSSPGQKSQYWIVLWWLTMTWVNKPHVLVSKSCEDIITIGTLFEWFHYWQIAYVLNTVHSWIQKVFLLVRSLLTTYLYLHTLETRHLLWKILMAWNFICNHNFYIVIHYLQKITKVRYLPKAYYRLPPKSCHHFRTKSNTLLKRPHHLVPHLHFWRNLLSQYFSVHFLSVLPKAAINRKSLFADVGTEYNRRELPTTS